MEVNNCEGTVNNSLLSESDHVSADVLNETNAGVTCKTFNEPLSVNNEIVNSECRVLSSNHSEPTDGLLQTISETSSDRKDNDVESTSKSEVNTISSETQTKGESQTENICVELEVKETINGVNPLNINQNECKSAAFTKCQPNESGTDDSQSDSSSSSSDSESDSDDTSTDEENKQSDELEDSDDDAPVTIPNKNRLGRSKDGSGIVRKKKLGGIKYKDELDIDDLPPIEDLHITVLEDQCEPLGTICSIVNQLVVIESMENKPALNLDSLLFRKDGSCIGQIFDVFGPVKTPFYTVRFNCSQDILDKEIKEGQIVYCAPQTPHTKYVFVYQLMQQKGSDASWKHNYEVPESQRDYSDDEEERKAKRRHHQRSRGRPGNDDEDSKPSLRKLPKSQIVSDYRKYTGDEWYRARVSEMNQFNRLPQGQRDPPRNQNSGYSRGGISNSSFYRSSTEAPNPFSSPPPPLIRPPITNNWNRIPTEAPPQTRVPTFSNPPSYERLNSNISFMNPMAYSSHTPPPNQWLQRNRPQSPYGMDSTRNIPPHAAIPQPPWSRPPPPPPPPLTPQDYYPPPQSF